MCTSLRPLLKSVYGRAIMMAWLPDVRRYLYSHIDSGQGVPKGGLPEATFTPHFSLKAHKHITSSSLPIS